MGFSTWTDATSKPQLQDNGYDYVRSDVIEYGSFAKLIAPDGTEYVTSHYDGLGTFGGEDVFELVVDWNRELLCEIAKKKNQEEPFFSRLAMMLGEGKTEAQVTRYVEKQIGNDNGLQYLLREWKRNIGIMIACEDEDNKNLRYPIKITGSREKMKYADLYPSYQTQ